KEGTNEPILLITGISTYSAGVAVDREGNLFAASADDNSVRRLSKAQLDAALAAQTPLAFSAGTPVVQLDVSTTLAVDEYGCLWAAGYQAVGMEVYNPRLDAVFHYAPGRSNTMYRVDTFTRNHVPYISYLNQSGYTTGASVEYGYDYAAKFARDGNRDFHSGLGSACDVVIYEFATGQWFGLSPDGSTDTMAWGWAGAYPVPADYDGDGTTDLAVFQPSDGAWNILRSSDGRSYSLNWGWNAVIPVQADYDGDGLTDVAVYYPINGEWIIWSSLNNAVIDAFHGWSEAMPVPGDYDGDGRADLAVYYPADGSWIVRGSATGETKTTSWGWSEAYPVPADYDGDGITDMAVYHPASGGWSIRNSGDPAHPTMLNWGWAAAIPVPADYDGDGLVDPAVYHASSGSWFVLESDGDGSSRTIRWGWSAGFPATSTAARNLLY
ncbi:MAG: VCBS repeat-containing protein, partial [Kiritimatiellae bacterium]|nr:VCBS repeat-containing protein [Kiritimatiellia bacterium]